MFLECILHLFNLLFIFSLGEGVPYYLTSKIREFGGITDIYIRLAIMNCDYSTLLSFSCPHESTRLNTIQSNNALNSKEP